jgi:hypothetical protein
MTSPLKTRQPDDAPETSPSEPSLEEQLRDLSQQAYRASYEIGKAVTRRAITQGALRTVDDLTHFVAGSASTAALHLASNHVVETGDVSRLPGTQAAIMKAWGELLIALAADIDLVGRPPASATTQ